MLKPESLMGPTDAEKKLVKKAEEFVDKALRDARNDGTLSQGSAPLTLNGGELSKSLGGGKNGKDGKVEAVLTVAVKRMIADFYAEGGWKTEVNAAGDILIGFKAKGGKGRPKGSKNTPKTDALVAPAAGTATAPTAPPVAPAVAA